VQEGLLALEVHEHRAVRDAGLGRDGADVRGLEAVALELSARDLQDALAGRGLLLRSNDHGQ
jgi:hypothetical protein